MGSKLLFTGLTIIMAADILPIPAIKIVGAVIMVIGCGLYIMDK